MSAIAKYRECIREMRAAIATIEKFGEDDHNDETVLFFKRSYLGGDEYTYAAIKAVGRWYLTGRQRERSYSWEDLVEEHLRYASEVWVATEWTAL